MKKIFFCLLAISLGTGLKAQTKQEAFRIFYREEYRTAREAYTRLMAVQPTDAELHYRIGLCNYYLELVDSANMFFQSGKAIGGKHGAMCTMVLGKMKLDKEDTTGVKEMIDGSVKGFEKDIEVLMCAADAWGNALKSRNVKKGIEYCNRVFVIEKQHVECHIMAGDIYGTQIEGGGNAMSQYEKATEINPLSAKAHTRIGVLYSRARNYGEALSALNRAQEVDTSYWPGQRELGDLFYISKQYEKAKEVYGQYIRKSEFNISTATRYAYILFLAKDYAGTTAQINMLVQRDSSNNILSRLVGYSYYEQGNYPEGVKFMEKFFAKADPKKIISSDYKYYGRLLNKTKQDSLAVIYLEEAYQRDTTDHELLSDLGKSYMGLKKYDQGKEAYQKRIDTGKSTSADHFQLGLCNYYTEQYAQADSCFSKVISIQPNYYLSYWYKGRSITQLDSLPNDSAKWAFEKAVELGSADKQKNAKNLIIALNYLAFYYVQKDQNEAAILAYTQILELDPQNKDANANKKLLETQKK